MFYRSFTIQIVSRLLLLTGSIAGLVWLFFFTDFYFTSLGVLLLIIAQVILFIRYIYRLFDDVYRFSDALAHGDHALHYPLQNKSGRLHTLYASFNRAIDFQKKLALQKEAAFHLFRTILEKVHFGVIVLQGNTLGDNDRFQEILFMNEAASALLDIPVFKYWHRLESRMPDFARKIALIQRGGKSFMEMRVNEQRVQLSVEVLPVKSPFYDYLIISVQNIRDEIEQKEIEAWNKLIRVLSHEILNSITPINSLADTLDGLMRNRQLPEITEEEFEDITLAVRTIRKRTEGLMDFVRDYRKMAELPTPVLKKVSVEKLLSHIRDLMQPVLQKENVRLEIDYPGSRERVKMDEKLIGQVLINLIMNSLYAMEKQKDPCLQIYTHKKNELYFIEIKDNGKGIAKENLGKIFIPFYTTREDGSGIGLTICKNIMHLHGGSLDVHSEEGEFTVFSLLFKD